MYRIFDSKDKNNRVEIEAMGSKVETIKSCRNCTFENECTAGKRKHCLWILAPRHCDCNLPNKTCQLIDYCNICGIKQASTKEVQRWKITR